MLGDEDSGTRCRWIYAHRTALTAGGCALAMSTLFVGAILMVRFADRTAGWSLLIISVCALLAVFSFLTIMNVIYCTCPGYIADPADMPTQSSASSASVSISLGDEHDKHPRDDTTVEDEFEL